MERPFPRSPVLRALLSVVLVVGVLGGAALGALLVLTQTQWGHERVRGLIVSQLGARVAGRVRVGRVSGNLLREATLHDVSITDSAGAPFVAAEAITTRMAFGSLFQRKLHLYGVRLVRPVIVLDKPPGPDGKWNYRRLFPGDSTARPRTDKPGFGSDVRLAQVRVIEGRFTVRSPWKPSDEKPPAERQDDVRQALAGETRIWVVPHPLGYQKVSDFRAINGFFPLLRLADPEKRPRRVEIAQLSMTAQPFRPPVAEVLDVQGAFEMSGDSAWWRAVRARLPGSLVTAQGRYNWENDDFRLDLQAPSASFTDFRWVYTRFPNGGGSLNFELDWSERADGTEVERYRGTNANIRVGNATLAGDLGIEFTEKNRESAWRFFDTNMRFARLETRLIEQTLPFMKFPRHGTISGRGRVAGTHDALHVADVDFTWADRLYGVNHALMNGTIGWTLDEEEELDALLAKNLRLTLLGVQPQLLHGFNPELVIPVSGTVNGRLVLDMKSDEFYKVTDADATHREGSYHSRYLGDAEFRLDAAGEIARFHIDGRAAPIATDIAKRFLLDNPASLPIGGQVSGPILAVGSATDFRVRGDIVHEESGSSSRLTGGGTIRTAGAGRFDVNVRAHPIALATVGRFAPALELRGTATGPVRVTGTKRDLRVNADVSVAGGGQLAVRGAIDVSGENSGYDVVATANVFNANAISGRAPVTSLTANATARGRGLAPATMSGAYALDVTAASRVDDLRVDQATLRASVGGGLAQLDTLTVRSQGVLAQAGGAFGLVAGRSGELTYRVEIDSLQRFHRVLAGETAEGVHRAGVVAPRPLRVTRARERARADSARVADSTEVERLATGRDARRGPIAVADERGIPSDSVAGAFVAAGVLRGNLTRFDARGRAAAEDLVLRGSTVGGLRAEYALTDFRTPQATAVVAAQASDLTAAGFAFDSADVRVTHTNGTGDLAATVKRDDQDFGLAARYTLHAAHSEVHFNRLAIRLDTTIWQGMRPGAVQWGERGIGLRDIELRNQGGGRLYANGLLPTEGNADLYVEVDNLQVADVTALLQSDPGVRGIATGRLEFEGTTASPRFRGAFGVIDGAYRGTAVPNLRATLAYANGTLNGRAEALAQGGAPLATAEGTLPINLAISGVTGPRLGEGGVALDVNADSLPVDVLSRFTDAVSDVRGIAAGRVTVRGSARNPRITGALALHGAQMRVVPTGVLYHHINGVVRMAGDTVMVDSLVAESRGTIRLHGGLGVRELTRPSFELYLRANNARVLDDDRGEMFADAEIAMAGPFDAVYVSGGARIRNGVYYLPPSDSKSPINAGDPAVFNVIDTSVVRDEELLPIQNPFLDNLRMEVSLYVDRDVWVRRNDANVEIYTPVEEGGLLVRVDRRSSALGVTGVVSTDRGEYEFLSKRFKITRGSATFIGSPDLNPTLQATGEYEVQLPGREAINIRVIIGGTLENPRITLESDAQPPIAQSDLLSYLVFDRSTSSLLQTEGSGLSGTSGGSALVGEAAAMAARRLASIALGVAADELEGEATRTLELDVFNITPADVPTELSSTGFGGFLRGTRIELGKYTDPDTFVGLAIRPATLGPGLTLQRRLNNGFRLEMSSEPRFVLREPSLAPQDPVSARNWAVFLVKEWRY